jgi:hypothetical protein
MTDDNKGRGEGGQESGSFFKKVKNMGQGDGGAKVATGGVANDVDASEKRKTLLSLLLALGILQTLYMNLATFLPLYTKDNYIWVDPFKVGLILA